MKKTAIMEAIEDINTKRSMATNQQRRTAYLVALSVLNQLLPKEREIIEEAYKEGHSNAISNEVKFPSDYYDTNYSQTENKEG